VASEATTERVAHAPGAVRRRRLTAWPTRFVALAGIWGFSFVFIKVADEALSPTAVALGRVLLGGATLLAILAVRRERLPRDRGTWAHLTVAALLMCSVPFTLFAAGEREVPSVLAGIWNGTTPLFAVPLAVLLLVEPRPTRVRIAGILIGFLGVLVVLGAWRGFGGASLEGNLLCLGGAACYGAGFPYVRRNLTGRASGLSLAAGQMVCASVQLALVTPLLTAAPGRLPLRVLGAMVGLGVLGTGLAYVLNFSIIRDVGPTVSSTVTYVVPVFATVAGVLALGEHLTWNEPLGASVIILGALLAQGRVRRGRIARRGARA
jgi:drug/metabolite transporter (DMT)-like permease